MSEIGNVFSYVQIGIGIVFVFALILFVFLFWFLFLKPSRQERWQKNLEVRLKKLKVKSNLDNVRQVIEYDKLLEFTLKEKYRLDVSLGKILKSRADKFSKNELNDIWYAHKLRNKLVHSADFDPSDLELKKAKIIIKRYLEDLLN